MSVVDVKEKWSTPEGQSEADKKGGGSQTAKRSFSVLVDDPLDTVITARTADGIPRLRESHPQSFALRAVRKTARAVSQLLFDVDVDYESPTREGKDSPLDEPAKIKIGGTSGTEKVDEDIDGAPIVNPNWERYEPQEIDWADLAITIQKNVADPGLFNLALYQKVVNSDDFLIFPPGTCKIDSFQADNVIDSDFEYWTRTAEIHVRMAWRSTMPERAWWLRIRCEGLYEYLPALQVYVRALEGSQHGFGEPTSQPVLLYANNNDGHIEGERIPIGLPSDADFHVPRAQWQEFQVYRTLPFAPLNLL